MSSRAQCSASSTGAERSRQSSLISWCQTLIERAEQRLHAQEDEYQRYVGFLPLGSGRSGRRLRRRGGDDGHGKRNQPCRNSSVLDWVVPGTSRRRGIFTRRPNSR